MILAQGPVTGPKNMLGRTLLRQLGKFHIKASILDYLWQLS